MPDTFKKFVFKCHSGFESICFVSGVSPVPLAGFCVFVMAGASPAVGLVVSEEKPS